MKTTQKYIIKVLLTLLFFPIIISAQFPNYSKSYNYNQFLQGYTSGGGGVSVNINNNIFTLSFSAGFTETYLKQGIVASLDGYTTSLPNTEIPIPNGSFFDGKGYKFYLINNKICIYGNSPQRISSFSSSITISLTSPIPVSTKIVDYLNNYTGQNKTVSTEYLTSQGQSGNKKISIMYFDGLGRELESVAVGITPSGKDLIIPFEYDIYGRKAKEYLPIPTSQSGGLLVDINTAKNTSSSYYGEPAFAEKFYDNSPLNRVTLQGAPGNSWQIGSGHEVKFGYEVNTLTDNVKKYYVTTTLSGDIYNISFTNSTSNYAAGLLTKKIAKDEDWTSTDGNNRTTEEYTNKEGQTILVRKYIDGTKADTYYVYDIYGNLTYVISPLASANTTISQTALDNLCYQYKYDKRNRLVEKKLPGKGWEYMIYDKQNRLAATQDANLRAKSQWLFTKYDNLGRILYTGITTGSTTRATEQALVDDKTDNNEAKSTAVGFTSNGLGVYYTNSTAYPTSISTLLSVNYYDSYPVGMPTTANQIQGANRLPLYSVPSNSVLTTKGLSTANFLKNIDDNSWTKVYNFYDEKNRIIATHSYNYLGGYTKTENKLNFIGLPTETYTYHKRLSTDTEIAIKEKFEYDTQNRLIKHWHNVNNATNDELLTFNEYNELGQLKNKKVGGTASTPIQTVDYKYNVRGWLTQINDPANLGTDLFGFEIKYQNPDTSKSTPIARYNGNISQTTWATKNDEIIRTYTYQYDKLNRLTDARLWDQMNLDIGEYQESLTYDLNGNISTLYRTGAYPYSGATAPEMMDDLQYNYATNTNKLASLKEKGSGNKQSGYPLAAGQTGQTITYDDNGNMISQGDKGITTIKYNYLNLPTEIIGQQIIYGSNGVPTTYNITTKYTYNAAGEKLKKTYTYYDTTYGYKTVTTDYLNGFQYEGGRDSKFPAIKLKIFPTAEGYVTNNQPDYLSDQNLNYISYIYQYKDHLGNVRVNFSNGYWITEENNYYPFGLKHTGYNNDGGYPTYQYKYNGKELQETGMYDYGARFYMPDIGRWGVVDPLAEKSTRWSPYAYAFNNPLRFIDPDGRQNEDIVIRGTDKKEWRVKTAGEDVVYNVPFALKNSATLDVGIGNVDPGRFAVGYTVQADVGGGLGIGVSGGVQMSVVQFTDKNYSGYNYVYAGAQEQASVGAQATVSASVGGSVSIAYNTSKDKIEPTTYAGVTSSAGLSADAKFIAGGGVNVNVFSGSAKAPGWKGVSLGVSVGVGAGANAGSGNVTLSKTWLLNDVKPTAQRSLIDRAVNAVNPVASAIATGTLDKIKQYNSK